MTRGSVPDQEPRHACRPYVTHHHGRPDALTVSLRFESGWVVASVAGELDLATGHDLDRVFDETKLIETGHGIRLALDVNKLMFCDSSGLTALLRLRRRVDQACGEFLLLNPRPRLSDLVRRTRLNVLLPAARALPA